MTETDIINIASRFRISGAPSSVSRFGEGLINDTFRISAGSGTDYVLQRINTRIFTDVDMLQSNIERVTAHLRDKYIRRGGTDPDSRILRLIRTDTGKLYFHNTASGGYWRMTVLIPDSYTRQEINEDNSRKAGEAISGFHKDLSDMDVPPKESIPHFHDMEYRLEEFRTALSEDRASRAASVRRLTERILELAQDMTLAERLHAKGLLPKRVCHCDTKINNLLFDAEGNVKAIIDLDTVMPAFVFSDYGDFLRTAASTTTEDSADKDAIHFRSEIFKAFTEGYIRGAADMLTDTEIQMLPFAVKLFPYMQCVRFLGDYLNGDTYYKTLYPEHNLVRAENQMTLLERMEQYDKTHGMGNYINSLL